MAAEQTDTLVVGAGQAGIAMSEHLTRCGVPHIVLERNRIAERWRTARWDSLVANGPAWHDRFPGLEFSETAADGFPGKEEVAAYLTAYAEKIDAPVRTGVEVKRLTRNQASAGFTAETSDGTIEARHVVAATGPFQRPVIPQIVPMDAPVTQIHSYDYRNPDLLPGGGVLVVGSGSSGAQIADELSKAARKVYLSVGPHDRPPRIYRDRDYCWWLGVLGKWDLATVDPATAHVTISVSGAYGGKTVDFRELAHQGITLVGITEGYADGVLSFAPDLAENVAYGDSYYLAMLDEADAYVARNGLDLPEEPEARVFPRDPECLTSPLASLDLEKAGVNTIVWATGYALDFGWLQVDAFGEDGKPKHQRGVSTEPGVYFLGLPWLSRRGSSFIWGVWHDAAYIAEQIAIQRNYLTYRSPSEKASSEV